MAHGIEVEPAVRGGRTSARSPASPPGTAGSTVRGGARRWRLIAATIVLGLAGCTTIPTEYREPPPLTREQRTGQNLRVFDRAWALVNQRYFDEQFRGVDWAAMRDRYRPPAAAAEDADALYRVINQMCGELKESHLGALSPRRAHELETEHRPAIGIRWQLIEDQRVVVDVVPGGPADRAGIRRGWLLLKRNGAPLRDGETFITRLKEPVRFEFLDEHDAVRAFTLQPALIDFDRREVRSLADGALYLRFDRFDRSSLSWLSSQLKAHRTARAVVVDLRSNRGGNTLVLDMAVAEFFQHRVALGRLIRRNGRSKDVHSLAWLPAGYAGRVIVLTGPATASAAEIFTHVLQHYHRALVIGRKTAGAVIYSRPYNLPDGGKIQVPIIDYVGLDGARLEGRGVTPEVEVPERSLAEVRADRDPELDKARELLRGK